MVTASHIKKKTIPFRFSDKHKAYIRECAECAYNVAEGAVRAGKTVDNVFAFAHELKTTPDRMKEYVRKRLDEYRRRRTST